MFLFLAPRYPDQISTPWPSSVRAEGWGGWGEDKTDGKGRGGGEGAGGWLAQGGAGIGLRHVDQILSSILSPFSLK